MLYLITEGVTICVTFRVIYYIIHMIFILHCHLWIVICTLVVKYIFYHKMGDQH